MNGEIVGWNQTHNTTQHQRYLERRELKCFKIFITLTWLAFNNI